MTFLDDLNGLPSAANGLTAAHVTLLTNLHTSDDRGGFYLAYYHMLDQMEAAGTVPVSDIADLIPKNAMRSISSPRQKVCRGNGPILPNNGARPVELQASPTSPSMIYAGHLLHS